MVNQIEIDDLTSRAKCYQTELRTTLSYIKYFGAAAAGGVIFIGQATGENHPTFTVCVLLTIASLWAIMKINTHLSMLDSSLEKLYQSESNEYLEMDMRYVETSIKRGFFSLIIPFS